MNHEYKYRSLAMLRSLAKGQLLGKYPLAAATFMTVLVMTALLRLLSFSFAFGSGMTRLLVSSLASFVVSLPLGIINVGILYMALKICCRETVHLNDVIYGFKHQPVKIIKVQAVFSAIFFVTTLPAAIFQTVGTESVGEGHMAAMVTFYLAGYAAYAFASLIFSQAFFLLLDFEDKDYKELLLMSRRLMDGHKKRLFLLWLSFVPLILLGLLTCCVGYIWIMPYIKVALANFYMDLMQAGDDNLI